jgi:hemoglobin-like flavoprotein
MSIRRHPIAILRGDTSRLDMPLDHNLIRRLEESFDELSKQGMALGERFYARLFAAAPEVRSLFRAEPEAQAVKLVEALRTVVQNLTAPKENAAVLAELGRRHAAYGARPEHYALVTDLLVDTIGDLLGPSADPLLLEDWRMTIRLVSSQMIAAAEEAGDDGRACPPDQR